MYITQINGNEITLSGGALRFLPIDSVLITPTNPAEFFGGTWERIEDVFLFFRKENSSYAESGGSADAVIVEHYHDRILSRGYPQTYSMVTNSVFQSGVDRTGTRPSGTASDGTEYLYTSYAGESGTGKNMPPYKGVVGWQRIA